MTSNQSKKMQLVSTLSEGANEFPILGHIVFWNVFNVQVTRQQLGIILAQCGLKASYARTHNYRSAFIRALREMEEQRIIRLVEEDGNFLRYQFTAEHKIGEDAEARLEYDRETIITIDKEAYRSSVSIKQSVAGKPEICEKLAALFEVEKDKYNSADITRMIKRIFASSADIVSLREQGGVYFVPSVFADTIQSMVQLANAIAGLTFEHLPIPNVESCRAAIKNAVMDELEAATQKLDEEIESAGQDNDITEKWLNHRLTMIGRLRTRLEQYASILDEKEADQLNTNLTQMADYISGSRKLDLG